MPPVTDATLDLLRLSLTPGLGPTLTRRAVEALGSSRAVLEASEAELATVPRIGQAGATRLKRQLRECEPRLERELLVGERHDVRFVSWDDEAYPALLRDIPDPPPVLRVRGALDPSRDVCSIAIVGSRACSPYGVDQTQRFAGALAERGLAVVSGGARGVDTWAHRAALRARGRTVVVMGCGLAHCYPPENAELFDEVVDLDGCIVSELPLEVAPARENFPARNRIISGMSLGVLVIEAGARSGALITARLAAEEHHREVMALPGRVDNAMAFGAHELIRSGAALVTSPADVVEILETPARRVAQHAGAPRFAAPPEAQPARSPKAPARPKLSTANLSDTQRAIVEALAEPRTLDDIARLTGIDAGVLRAETTTLEIRRVVKRQGDRLVAG